MALFTLFLSLTLLFNLSTSSPTSRVKRIVSENEPVSTNSISNNEDEYDGLLPPNALADQPKITPDGDYIVEGDIVIPKEIVERKNSSEDGLQGRTAVAEPVLYWPGGVVVYSYHQCKLNIIIHF